ncbi:hypothetical protein SC408_10750 [Legionella pneumophila serogroup 1]|nr:hypothetical protein [Legionella pneumophila]
MSKVVFILLGLISFSIHAEEIIYCPAVVECNGNRLIDCKVKNTEKDGVITYPENWVVSGVGSTGNNPMKGVFEFQSTYIYNLANKDKAPTKLECRYKKINADGTSNYVKVQEYGKLSGTSFEPFLKKSGMEWDIKNDFDGKLIGVCISKHPILCPLVELPFLVYTFNLSEGNKKHVIIRVKNAPYNELGKLYSTIGGYFKLINYEDVFNVCGSFSLCTLEIESYNVPKDTYFRVGVINIDLSTPNIIKVVDYRQDNRSLCYFQKKKEPYNTFMCKE